MTIDPEQKIFEDAIAKAAGLEKEMRDANTRQWYLIVERELPSEGSERVISIYRSDSIKPWDALGLLRFAETIEGDVVVSREHEQDEA